MASIRPLSAPLAGLVTNPFLDAMAQTSAQGSAQSVPWTPPAPNLPDYSGLETSGAGYSGAYGGGAPAQGGAQPSSGGQPAFSYDPTKYGDWRGTITPDEAFIISHESGFNPNSYNKTVVMDQGRAQHAFGLGQLIDENRDYYGHKLGINPNTTNPLEQLALFRAYAVGHYGSMANARARYKVGVGY